MDASIPGSLPIVLRGMAVRAGGGVVVGGPGTIERSRVIGGDRAVVIHGGNVGISNSLLTLTKTYGAALKAETSAPGVDTNVTADGLTVFAPSATLDTIGIGLTTAPDITRSVHLNLTNSIVRAGVPLFAIGTGGGTATISASYSDYNPAQNVASQNASISGSHVSNVGDAGFNEKSGHEYELLPASPLLDRGDPDATQGVDLNGNARAADGNGDGFARRDLGAFELQPAPAGPPPGGGTAGGTAADATAPVISGFRAAKRRVRVAHVTRFRYTLSESGRVTLRFKRIGRHGRTSAVGTLKRAGTKGLNRIRFSGRIGRRALRTGRYRVVIRATDAAGNRSVPSAARFRIVR